MSILATKNAKLTLDFLNTVILDQNYDIFDELLMPNSVNYDDFGTAIGIERVKANATDWFSIFTDPNIRVTDSIVSDESVVYRFIQNLTHIDTFKSIPATGNRISADVMAMFRTNGEKITGFHISSNLEHIVCQLIDVKQVDINKILQRPIVDRKDNFPLQKALNQLQSCGIKLTIQQLRCLSLWFSGRTSKEIAALLNISYRTVEAHLAVIKEKLECRRKKEIFDILQQHGLLHIMQECSNTILIGLIKQGLKHD